MYTNRRCSRLRISDDSIMQDTMMETCDLHVFVLRAGTSRMSLFHVVMAYIWLVAKHAQQTYSSRFTRVSVPTEDGSHQQEP
jgi:hypothetical protein